MSKRIYPEWFINSIANEEDKNRAMLGELTSRDRIDFICSTHGVYSDVVSHQIKLSTMEKSRGCPLCGKKNKYVKMIETRKSLQNPYPQWFLDELVLEDEKKLALSNELVSTDRITLNCPKHGNYKTILGNHIERSTGRRKSNGCPGCLKELRCAHLLKANKIMKPYPQWFIDELAHDTDKELAKSGELDTNIKVDFICPDHGIYEKWVFDKIKRSTGERLSYCPYCFVSNHKSSYEDIIADYISTIYNGRILHNDRGEIHSDRGNSLEFDIYCKDVSIAIEFNGSYYHQTKEGRIEDLGGVKSKPFDYHKDEFEKALAKGIHLVQIFDVDWMMHEDRIKMYLRNLFITKEKVYARVCEVREIMNKEAHDFCDRYHLQGSPRITNTAIGLFKGDELLSVMTFTNSGYYNKDGVTLTRYCVKDGITVIGGANKILSFYENSYNPKCIISYSDNDYFTGSIYSELGFEFAGNSSTRYYWYSNERGYFTREECQLSKLAERYPDVYKEYESYEGDKEVAIMSSLKFVKVYRSGTRKWKKVYDGSSVVIENEELPDVRQCLPVVDRVFPKELLKYYEVSVDYLNNVSWNTIVPVKCFDCGRLLNLKIIDVVVKYKEGKSVRCRRCSKAYAGTMRIKRPEYPKWLYEESVDLNESMNSKSIVTFKCPIHGTYKMRLGDKIDFSTMTRKRGCKLCARHRNPYPQWFIDIISYDEDKERARFQDLRTTDIIVFKCPIHGEWKRRVGDVIRISTGEQISGCPHCKRSDK